MEKPFSVEICCFVRLRRSTAPVAAAEDNTIMAMILMLSGIAGFGFDASLYVMYPQLSGTSGLPAGVASAGGHC